MSFWTFLSVWLTVNVVTTLAVRRAGALGLYRPGMWITMVWITPIVGPFMALLTLIQFHRHHREATRQSSRADHHELHDDHPDDPPATDLTLPSGQVLSLAEGLGEANGFPLLKWRWVDTALAELDDAERPTARTACQRLWLTHLRHLLGPHFRLIETEDAFVLSSLEDVSQRAIAGYITQTRKRVSQLLAGLAEFPAEGKSILIVMDDEAAYYQYVSIYYPTEGEFAFSSGMFIDAGCPHFVVCRDELARIEPVIAHELTHSALAHLSLPLWLDEGIAVNTERRIAGLPPSPHTPFELHAMHGRFWNDERIQEFWSGDSFRRTDDGNLLSYALARVLVEQTAADWPAFASFVRHARRDDAGEAAARQHLGIDLGASAAAVTGQLGATGWAPRLTAPVS